MAGLSIHMMQEKYFRCSSCDIGGTSPGQHSYNHPMTTCEPSSSLPVARDQCSMARAYAPTSALLSVHWRRFYCLVKVSQDPVNNMIHHASIPVKGQRRHMHQAPCIIHMSWVQSPVMLCRPDLLQSRWTHQESGSFP